MVDHGCQILEISAEDLAWVKKILRNSSEVSLRADANRQFGSDKGNSVANEIIEAFQIAR